MDIASNIKAIRTEKGILQKTVAEHIRVDKSTYSKIEKGNRELTIIELQKISNLFDMIIDQLVNFEGDIPKEVTIEDKNSIEQINLIKQLDEEDCKTIFSIIDKMLTNKKFKDFFKKNVAIL
jgi:transcriptional regulator with XRE-family HTH domain